MRLFDPFVWVNQANLWQAVKPYYGIRFGTKQCPAQPPNGGDSPNSAVQRTKRRTIHCRSWLEQPSALWVPMGNIDPKVDTSVPCSPCAKRQEYPSLSARWPPTAPQRLPSPRLAPKHSEAERLSGCRERRLPKTASEIASTLALALAAGSTCNKAGKA